MSKQNASLQTLELTLEEYLVKKAPFQLPPDVKEAIVKFGPWVVLILMILSLPVVIAGLTFGSFMAPFSMMAGKTYWLLPAIASLIAFIFNVMALPGLFNRTQQGWRYAYYGELVTIVSSILATNLFSAIIGGAIGLYILFQVKNLYK